MEDREGSMNSDDSVCNRDNNWELILIIEEKISDLKNISPHDLSLSMHDKNKMAAWSMLWKQNGRQAISESHESKVKTRKQNLPVCQHESIVWK